MLSLFPLSDRVLRESFSPILDLDSLYSVDPSGTAQYETDSAIFYEFDLAGYSKEHIKLSIDKQKSLLKVFAERPNIPSRRYAYNSLNSREKHYTISLRSRESSYSLDLDNTKTELSDGILKVTVPKLEQSSTKSSEIFLEIN